MATTLSSHPHASAPQHANQFHSSPLVLPRKRSSSELYDSSSGVSDGTPTPRTRRLCSRPGFSSDPSSPTFYTTPPSAQLPRDASMEESGTESDVYDQFDLGDFTKEEIKRYESMVGPGERLLDAAPPKEETTDAKKEHPLGTSIIQELPAEFHDMLEAALSNALYRVATDGLMPANGTNGLFGTDEESEESVKPLVSVFMAELAKPTPQMERFMRHNCLREDLWDQKGADRLGNLCSVYGRRISVSFAQRLFEKEVYDFGIRIGLSKDQAIGHVIKARKVSSKCGVDLPELGDYESNECEELEEYLYVSPQPEVFKTGKAAIKHAKKARKAELCLQKEASRQAEENRRQETCDHQAEKPINFPKHPTKVQPFKDQAKPLKQKKSRKKRKLEPELEVEDRHRHKKSKKKDHGSQHSPFFQRSPLKADKVDPRKLDKQPMDLHIPMIHPLSSLRSTPTLPSFNIKEFETENKRIIQMDHDHAHSKSVPSTSNLPNHPTGPTTPTSSPISLLELNQRLLKGTIYQDGIILFKPDAATLSVPKKPKKPTVTVSPFFSKSPIKKPKASDKVSCIPFPPLHSTSFGLVQERLSHDPFRLLIAVIFLNKTRGSVALPVFYTLMERYPTPADLAAANQADVVQIIQHLGLQNQRAKKCINLAKAWLARPPEKGKRYRVLHYPKKYDGKDVGSGDIIDDQDDRVAWEIGQLPGIGVYAIDSWRIFCRDQLRGLPCGLPLELTPEAKEEELQMEWTRVLAGDKELRAYLRWRWLRNGWEWDPVTGERKEADAGELAKAGKGGVMYEGDDGDIMVGVAALETFNSETKVEEDNGKENVDVEKAIAVFQTGEALETETEVIAAALHVREKEEKKEAEEDTNAAQTESEISASEQKVME